jgi:flagellar hook-associated protein 1
MALLNLLSIARTALLTHQRAMTLTAQNVANANTPGYSRERLRIVTALPARTDLGPLGRGVTDLGIDRARSTFFDMTYRQESGLLGGSGTLREFLGQIEAAVNEPSDTGISASLNGMFQAFSDLANDPVSGTNRDLVRSSASRLIQQLHQLDGQIEATLQNATERMRTEIAEANAILKNIAELNTLNLAAGGDSPGLEDQRDILVDRLSGMLAVRVLDRGDGTIGVMGGDALLVDGAKAQTLVVRPLAGGGFGIGLEVGSGTFDPRAGSLKSYSDLTSTIIPGIRAQLDTFARSLVTEINAIHRTGYTLDDTTNTDFFDPTGLTAGSIRLTAAIEASGNNIAAGGTPEDGDNTVALQIAGLATAPVASLGGKSLPDYYADFASAVGVGTQNAEQDASTHQALVDHAETERLSVSGVSIDEEMVNLIAQQAAYAAAARLIQTADEILQDLMQMV